MSKLRRPTRETQGAVTPSSRDSISGWLDVLTSMLAIPESQRSQVRDELEDHLRSRVDDLLITGTPEPEAIRQAVAELGETAELAKLISHAHTHSKPRRQIMNAALILTAIAGLSIGGLSLNSGNTNTTTGQQETGALLEMEAHQQIADDTAVALQIDQGNMGAILRAIADGFGRDLELSQGSKTTVNLAVYTGMGNQFTGTFTLGEVLDNFRALFAVELAEMEVVVTDRAIRVLTQDEYQREQVVTRVYASPDWLQARSDVYDYAQSLKRLLEVKHDLTFASIEVIDEAIVVAGPPKIQDEVVKMMIELDGIVGQRRTLREAEQKEREARQEARSAEIIESSQKYKAQRAAEFERTVERIQEEFDGARQVLLASKAELRMIEEELADLDSGFSPDMDIEDMKAKISSLDGRLDEARLKVDENQERYDYLRNRLLDTQYAQLFEGLE